MSVTTSKQTEQVQKSIFYDDDNVELDELPYFHRYPRDDCAEYKGFINEFRENKTWGYVVFRTVYDTGTDDKFKSAMLKIEHMIRDVLERSSKGDKPSTHPGERQALIEFILSHYQNEIIEDESLNNATVATLQEHFQMWLTENERNVEEGSCGNHYFLVVDKECLDSVSAAPIDALQRYFKAEKIEKPMLKFVENETGHVETQEAWWLWEHFWYNCDS